MTASSSFFFVCALIVALAHCAELSSVQNQLRSFLQSDMIATAKTGYQPNAFAIPGSELTQNSEKFLSSGTFSVSSGYEASCSDAFLSVAVAADSCIVDGVFSYKLQLVTDDCAGAEIQYFFDDACHLYAGSSELSTAVEECSVGYHDHKNRAVYTSLTCSASSNKQIKEVALLDVVTAEPSAEPTAEPSAEPTASPTVPTRAPTYSPTARPSAAVSAFPTAAQPSTVSFSAQQTIAGLTLAQYNTQASVNEACLKKTIVSCMDGVSTSDVTNFLAADGSSNGAKIQVVHLRSLAGTNNILITYRIVTNSKLTSDQLFSQLNQKVNDGTFTILMQQNADGDSAVYLMGASSDDVSTVGGGNNARLSGGAIAAIVVGVVFGAALILLAVYLIVVGAGSGGESHHQHKPVEAGPPAEL